MSGNKPAPDGIALRPEILALVIEPFSIPIENDAKGDAVNAAGDATVIFWRTGIDRHGMALVKGANRLHPMIQQAFQNGAGVPWCAAYQKILRSLAPPLRKPVKIGFKAAGSGDHFLRLDHLPAGQPHTLAEAVLDQDIGNLGIVMQFYSDPFGMAAQAVQQRPSATKEKGIGAA